MKNFISGLLLTAVLLAPSLAFSDSPKLTFQYHFLTDEQKTSIDYYVGDKLVGNEKCLLDKNNYFGFVAQESSGSIPDGVYIHYMNDKSYYFEITMKDGKKSELDDYREGKLFSRRIFSDGQLSEFIVMGDAAGSSKSFYHDGQLIRTVIHIKDFNNPASDVWTGHPIKDGVEDYNQTLWYDSSQDADMGLDRDTKALYTFKPVAQKYYSLKKKPKLPADARAFAVQAQDAMDQKQFNYAVSLYQQALEIAPWWPQGHYNEAEILGETGDTTQAALEMKKYLMLEPKAKDAQKASDEISKWEGRMGK